GESHPRTPCPGGWQFEHCDAGGWAAQDVAVGDDVALDIEEPRSRVRRRDQAAHHLAGEIGKQDFSLVDRLVDRALAETRGKDLALHFQRFDLLIDEARLVLAEIEK